MASAGNGSAAHMGGELFKAMTGVSMVHVPFRGGAPALTSLIAGQVQVMFDNLPTSIEQIRAGNLRALAVTTTMRSEALPDIPTVADFVPGYEASGWFGAGAPRNTPPHVIDRLNLEINAGLSDPRIMARLAELGGTVIAGAPAEFGRLIAEETEKWAKVVKFSGAKPDCGASVVADRLLGAFDHRRRRRRDQCDEGLDLLARHRRDVDLGLGRIGDELRVLHGVEQGLAQRALARLGHRRRRNENAAQRLGPEDEAKHLPVVVRSGVVVDVRDVPERGLLAARELDDGLEVAGLVVVAPERGDGRHRQPADAVHLAALDRHLDACRSRIARHHLHLDAEQVPDRKRR